jgi:hypothetical protein
MTQAADVLPWLLSLVTILSMIWAGSRHAVRRKRGWAVAMGGQALWLAYTIVASAWGFLPLNMVLTVIYYRNWSRA